MKGGAVITAGYSSAALCGQPGGLEVQTQAVSQLAALPHQSRDKEGRGTQQGLTCPSFASIFLVVPLLMSDVHTFLPSYLIIFIIKIIFISPAHREGKKDDDSESTRGGRVVTTTAFLPKPRPPTQRHSFSLHASSMTLQTEQDGQMTNSHSFLEKSLFSIRCRTGQGVGCCCFPGCATCSVCSCQDQSLHHLPHFRLLD